MDSLPTLLRPHLAAPLRPLPWRFGERPPPPPSGAAFPLLLLIDRRDALAPPHRTTVVPPHPEALLATLSAAERQRHASYRRPDDRERFLLARAALRQLLGGWLERPPAAVAIAIGPHGKPHCGGAPAFNLSHSGDLILLGFHSASEVGVDVERERSDLDWRPIARRVLPPAAVGDLEALPAPEQGQAFLQAWCRLEARLKAQGEGLAGLDRGRGGGGDAGTPGDAVWEVAVPPGYRAAAALGAALRDPQAGAAGGDRPSPRA